MQLQAHLKWTFIQAGMGALKTGTMPKESLARKQHLPEAIEALSVPGLPEMEAVKQDENLTCEFSLNRIRPKFDAVFMRHQMRCTQTCSKQNVKSKEEALQLVNLQDPSATGKAFDEALEWLMQAFHYN